MAVHYLLCVFHEKIADMKEKYLENVHIMANLYYN